MVRHEVAGGVELLPTPAQADGDEAAAAPDVRRHSRTRGVGVGVHGVQAQDAEARQPRRPVAAVQRLRREARLAERRCKPRRAVDGDLGRGLRRSTRAACGPADGVGHQPPGVRDGQRGGVEVAVMAECDDAALAPPRHGDDRLALRVARLAADGGHGGVAEDAERPGRTRRGDLADALDDGRTVGGSRVRSAGGCGREGDQKQKKETARQTHNITSLSAL
jgi:hypothetical protein